MWLAYPFSMLFSISMTCQFAVKADNAVFSRSRYLVVDSRVVGFRRRSIPQKDGLTGSEQTAYQFALIGTVTTKLLTVVDRALCLNVDVMPGGGLLKVLVLDLGGNIMRKRERERVNAFSELSAIFTYIERAVFHYNR